MQHIWPIWPRRLATGPRGQGAGGLLWMTVRVFLTLIVPLAGGPDGPGGGSRGAQVRPSTAGHGTAACVRPHGARRRGLSRRRGRHRWARSLDDAWLAGGLPRPRRCDAPGGQGAAHWRAAATMAARSRAGASPGGPLRRAGAANPRLRRPSARAGVAGGGPPGGGCGRGPLGGAWALGWRGPGGAPWCGGHGPDPGGTGARPPARARWRRPCTAARVCRRRRGRMARMRRPGRRAVPTAHGSDRLRRARLQRRAQPRIRPVTSTARGS